MKRLLSFIVALALVLSCTPVVPLQVSAGNTTLVPGLSCGAGLSWDLTNGVLTISGIGEMTDFEDDFLSEEAFPNSAPWNSQSGSITTVVIKEGVTTIGNYAFAYCTNLTSVEIPDSITSIGVSAFIFCTSLTDVYYGGTLEQWNAINIKDSSITSVTLHAVEAERDPIVEYLTWEINNGEAIITDCDESISGDITIPSTLDGYPVTSIGDSAFEDCYMLTNVEIPDSITSIGYSAFKYCESLVSITIPDSVTDIGYEAFYVCPSLTGIWADEENANYSSDSCGVLFNKNKTHLIQAPGNITGNYTLPDSVTAIGDIAFKFCGRLTGVVIPNSVTDIGWEAFYACSSLASVVIPESVTTIGEETFYNCSSLTDVYYNGTEEQWDAITIGSGNEELSEAAIHYKAIAGGVCGDNVTWMLDKTGILTISGFGAMDDSAAPWHDYSSSIYGIKVEDGVTSVDNFGNCLYLSSVSLPDSVTIIGSYAFSPCSLQNIVIPDSVTSIGDYAFACCYNLRSIIIPDSVTSIGTSVFELSSLESAIIGNGITCISDRLFANCNRLTSVTIGDNVTSIDSSAFYNCSSLTDVYYSGTQEQWDAIVIGTGNEDLTGATIHYNACGSNPEHTYVAVVTAPTCTEGGYTTYTCSDCGDSYVADEIAAIGHSYEDGICTGCGGVQVIARGTCGENLTWVLDATGTLTISGTGRMIDYANSRAPWYNTRSAIRSVVIEDGVATIGDSAFSWCTSLTSVTIPNSVTRIAGYAFHHCDSLTSVTIPDSVTYIGDGAFRNCDSLTSVTIPDSVISMDEWVFAFCDNLTNVTIGNGITAIPGYAFAGCSSLATVTIPVSVTCIGSGAFLVYAVEVGGRSIGNAAIENQSCLSDVYYGGTQAQWNAIFIDSDNEPLMNATIHTVEPNPDENAPQIALGSKTVVKGKEFTVTAMVKNNPGFSYLEVTPVIPAELTLVKVENGELISDFTKGKQYVWVADEDVTEDGLLLTFTFLVDDSVETGAYEVSFNVRTCGNYDEEVVTLYVNTANIEVIDFIYGDANGDNVIDGFDVIRLKKYLANYDYDTETSTVEIGAGADANGDGKVDGFDVIRLKKYLANYDYETGESAIVLGPQ